MNNICNSLCRLKLYSFRIINTSYLSVCKSEESNVVHDHRSRHSFQLSHFTRDNRIPCVTRTDRTKISVIHTNDHVTFCHSGERKNARGAKKREDMLSSRCGASVIEFASHRVSFNTRGSREIFISMYMHSRTCTPKSARYSKAHSDFRRFVLQSIHRVPNNLISTVLFLYYWNAK